MDKRAWGRAARWLYASLLVVIGIVLIGGGAYLVWLGGTSYYLLAGLATAASGILVWTSDRRATQLYGAMLVTTLAWAIWEAGFDGWALAARVVAPLVLGLPFLASWVRGAEAGTPSRHSGWITLGAAALCATLIGAGAHAIGPADYPDPLYQTGVAGWSGSKVNTPIADAGDWLNYGNDVGGSRFSGLDQLNPNNVANLKVAWEVHLGAGPGGELRSLETTPIKAGNSLYVCTAFNDVISIDAEDGHINWRFKSGISLAGRPSANCRGVAFFQVPGQTGLCAQRIITNTIDARLLALDAATGQPCPDFGANGQTDLTTGMGSPDIGYYYVSSAPTIVRGKIVLGGWVSDGQHWGEPSGVIRAYDATTGKFAWAFDMGRPEDHAEPKPGQSYTHSTPNSWAPMSADPELGLVYAPTGNPAVDYYGVLRRPFDDKYGSSVVALDVDTGNVRWSFQTTHHDLWDYDTASQPTLVDIPGPHGVQHALVQPTKRGELFLLDRATGKPLAQVEERAVPQTGAVPGERLSPTQPFSVGMPALSGPRYRERDMWGLTPIDQLWCRIKFKEARYEGTMTPPGTTPWVSDPGYLGGVDWGGVSVDRDRSLLIVNSNRVSNYDVLVPRAEADAMGIRASVKGSPRSVHGVVAQANTPYAANINPFLSPLGAPCNEPPYGRLTAIDLRTHKVVWSEPLGTARDSGPWGIPSMLPITMGTPNAGGSMTTRSGLIFLSATQEMAIRALDVTNGRQLWSARLPAGGQATPMTYWSARSNRQFVAIAAGGNLGLRTRAGDSIIAYALPK
jgi:quinoprotein glucose dehydrogenase